MATKRKKTASRGRKHVYFFGSKSATDGDGSQKSLLGGKGANLAEMCRIGLPVPAGMTITTEVCTAYYKNGRKYPATLAKEIEANLAKIEKAMGKKFDDLENPLLLSVRSGARESMPGMMDTILNLGINDRVVEALAKKTGNPHMAYDSYRRFLQMYGEVVMGVEEEAKDKGHDPFEIILSKFKKKRGVEDDSLLTVDDMKAIVEAFKKLIKERTGKNFPQKPMDQLWGAVSAVFNSWENDRAQVYRRKYNIPAAWGTAVNVQAMVFGNTGKTSGTGVCFTRDPATGKNVFYGEYLVNAQGEDVVAGVRTPKEVSNMAKDLPEPYKHLLEVRTILEKHFRDVQDCEFTVEDNKLWMLQTRNGKRTGLAAVHIAIDMVKEKLITQEEALKRIPAEDLTHILAPIFDLKAEKAAKKIGQGLPAGPGAASGRIYFHAPDAVKAAAKGDKVILTRQETSPEDLRGMIAAEGILTSRGGVSSHAALVARQMGKICVCGAAEVQIDYGTKTVKAAGKTLKEGDWISINGTTGAIYAGELKTAESQVIQGLVEGKASAKKSEIFKKYTTLMGWANKAREIGVRTNSDTPDQVKEAISFGGEGIGLTRAEHMFFTGNRIDSVRAMILADNDKDKNAALKKIQGYMTDDFVGIFTALAGRPATIRLLDPPLHEFLPHDAAQIKALAKKLKTTPKKLTDRVHSMGEENPMLGFRGCRLGVVDPDITAAQVRAIFNAGIKVQKDSKGKIKPVLEIMVPLVGFAKELEHQKLIIEEVGAECIKAAGLNKSQVKYTIGTMIEIPRAALTADKIAEHADFFSFGTNDLTQTTMGMSRDDSSTFLPVYADEDICGDNPFAVVDQEGVGQLIEMAVKLGRKTRKGMKMGICGEHGGEPRSVKYCADIGLDYVSCSPRRIPVAILAAAQQALGKK